MRWIRQRDSYSCGGVVLVNILKWLKYPATYATLPALKKLCKCEYPNGTGQKHLERALKTLGISFKRMIKPTIQEIDTHLDNGGIVLVHYCIAIGHYSLCVGRKNKNTYILINDIDNVTISELYKNDLKYRLELSFDGKKRWTWFIYPDTIDYEKIEGLLK